MTDAAEPGSDVTPELFRIWRSARVGAQNLERLTNPVWDWLVRSRVSAYFASQRFGIGGDDAGWSFARFGQSETTLADGSVLYIAGEHEDHYDPDFHIYNDVVIRYPDDRIEILGYPLDVFPPTDFHSATLVDDRILVVGNLGYPANRKAGKTQVVLRWERLTDRKWRSWQVSRADQKPMHLWRLRSLAQFRGITGAEEHRDSMQMMISETTTQVRMAYGAEPDLDLFAMLFTPGLVHSPAPDDPDDFGVHRIHVDGVVVRFVERMESVKVVVEGRLRDEIASALVEDLRRKLSALEHSEYVVTEL